MRALSAFALIAVVAWFAVAPVRHAEAKGNDTWVLTGGELGGYAMGGVSVDLVDTTSGLRMVPAPATRPQPRYDLYDSYTNFAIPYQMWTWGGAWVHYYPTAGLLEFQGSDAAGVPHTWYAAPAEIAATLNSAIGVALAEKAAGELDASPAAADFRERGLDKVSFRISPYNAGGSVSPAAQAFYAGDHGGFQIAGSASETLIMEDLADVVSRAPVASTTDAPAYEITYAGEARPGENIGGLLGYYSPPAAGAPGRFWDDGYSTDTDTRYYATTLGLDDAIADALRITAGETDEPPNRPAAIATHRDVGSAILCAAIAGSVLLAVLGVVRIVGARVARSG